MPHPHRPPPHEDGDDLTLGLIAAGIAVPTFTGLAFFVSDLIDLIHLLSTPGPSVF